MGRMLFQRNKQWLTLGQRRWLVADIKRAEQEILNPRIKIIKSTCENSKPKITSNQNG
jgi:hypothetical protein